MLFYTAYILINYPVRVSVFNCNILYTIDALSFVRRDIDLLIYTVAAVGPFFVTSLPLAPILGGVWIAALFFTCLWMRTTLISVWCFFAAIFSVFLYISLRLKTHADLASSTQQRQTS